MLSVPAQISNPVGLDAIIQDMQNYLSNQLSWLVLSFGRAYKNEDKDGNFFPEVYVAENEYLNVFASDLTDSMSFFDTSDTIDYNREPNSTYYDKEQEVKIIFFVNLEKAKNLSHRADENINNDIETAIQSYSSKLANWYIESVQTGIENVYSNYNYDGTVIVNYEPFYIVSFNMLVKYRKATYCS